MAMSAAERAKYSALPKAASVIIEGQQPIPGGEVEVTPDGGRVIFLNEDNFDYRLRLFKPETEPAAGIDVLVPAKGRMTVLIKENDEFMYKILNLDGSEVTTGGGGGPIKN
jgi:hypothetical protein